MIRFGGKDRLDLLHENFKNLIKQNVMLFIITKKSCDLIKILLHKVDLVKYFRSDDIESILYDRVIGNNHKLLQNPTNHQYSLNEKLLKIIEKCEYINDSVLYIDSDGNTISVAKINLCRTYGIKGVNGIQEYDFKRITKKYF